MEVKNDTGTHDNTEVIVRADVAFRLPRLVQQMTMQGRSIHSHCLVHLMLIKGETRTGTR